MFRFAHIEYLWLLMLIPVFIAGYIAFIQRKKRQLKAFGDPELTAELMPNVSRIRPVVKFGLVLLAFALLVIAVARPQYGQKEKTVKRQGIEVMIALDILFANSGDAIAHFAHLGGVVAGFLYMAVFQNGPKVLYHSPLSAIFRLFSRNPEKYDQGNSGTRSYRSDRVEEPEVLEGEVFYVDEQKRMDEILKKVERSGIQSLSESEREFLLKAGDRLRRRRGGF